MVRSAALRLPPLSLYVHLPWCVRKCPYCDFNSHPAPAHIPQTQYVDALLRDLEHDAGFVEGRRISTVFFGGGTPSLFAPEELGRFLDGVRARIGFESDVEVTLEANPGAIEHGSFRGYRDAGVNRISLGAQTFSAERLKALGRIHGAEDIAAAVAQLARAGLDNFNLDVMYALPGQSVEDALADVDAALALQPTHISHYQLTLEPGTAFYHRPPMLPDEEIAWRMQVECQDRLAARGYEQYEVSAYARAERQCRHNLNYWRFGDYLGVGAGAHGKATLVRPDGAVVRTTRLRQPREYLARVDDPASAQRSRVPEEELPFEYMLNALRLLEGFDAAAFESRTGVAFDEIATSIAGAAARGLLQVDRVGRLRPTELGRRFLNDLTAMFLPAASRA